MNDILQISTTNRIADYTDVARRRKAAISEAHEELKERTKEVELNLIVKKIKQFYIQDIKTKTKKKKK